MAQHDAAPAGATPLYRIGKHCHLEPPRCHPPLLDQRGREIARGELALVKQVRTAAADGVARYLVAVFGVAGAKRAELEVPEGWLRPKGLLATSTDVKLTSVRTLFQGAASGAQGHGLFQIPLFQRRYCWSEPQWEALKECCLGLLRSGNGDATHSLKRLMTVSQHSLGMQGQAAADSHTTVSPRLVLDGQQRLTTLCILLAAVRDCARLQGTVEGTDLARDVSSLLVMQPAVAARRASNGVGEAGDNSSGGGGGGDERASGALRWRYVVSPTLDDRPDFAEAMRQEARSVAEWPPPPPAAALLRCRAFFSVWVEAWVAGSPVAAERSRSVMLRELARVVLDGLHVPAPQ